MEDGIYEVPSDGVNMDLKGMVVGAILSQLCNDIKTGELPLDDEIVLNSFVPCFENFSFEFMRAINMKFNEDDAEARKYVAAFIDNCEQQYILGKKDLDEFANKQRLGGL